MYINKIYYHQFHPQALSEPDVSLLAHPFPIDQPAVGFALLNGSSQERMTYIPDESKVVYRSKEGRNEKTFDALK